MSIKAGDIGNIEFLVTNTGGKPKVFTWLDTVELVSFDSGEPIKLASKIHFGSLQSKSSYKVSINFVYPISVSSGVYNLLVTTDKNNKIQMNNQGSNYAESQEFNISEPLESSLEVATSTENLTVVAGQPVTVPFTVTNHGPGIPSSAFPMYFTLYLSKDQVIDPFDIVLCVQKFNKKLLINQPFQASFKDCNLPFQLTMTNYFLLIKSSENSAVTNQKYEKPKIALRNVGSLITSDIAVINVESQKLVYNGRNLAGQWKIRNNGTEAVSGYKCDTSYLSVNKVWDLDDAEVGTSCGLMSTLTPGTEKEYAMNKLTPLVKQAPFYSIVKTRSSINEIDLSNNIALSNNTTLIIHKNISLWVETVEDVTNEKGIWRIPNVPSSESLSISVSSTDNDILIDVFVNFDQPATTENFVAFAGQQALPKQIAVVKNTRKGDYYLFVRKTSGLKKLSKLNILAKIAIFEINNVVPKVSPKLADFTTTFQIKGSLFPSYFSVKLRSKSNEINIPEKNTYRFSSTLIYVTVNMYQYPFLEGDVIDILIVDDINNNNATFESAITIEKGEVGYLQTKVNIPSAVRIEENVGISVDIQNKGTTDLLPPILYLNITEDVLLHNIRENETFESNFLFLGASYDGLSGVLTPQSISLIEFEAIPKERQVANFPITLERQNIQSDSEHPYMNSKDLFKPKMMSNRQWDPVWNAFLRNVGSDFKTFHERICETSNHFSLIHDPTISIDKLVKFELDIANGIYTSNNIYKKVDIEVKSDDSPFLSIERYLNPQLSFRDIPGQYNGYGPFGRGWISPYW